jgi:hypothetical protein
MKGGWAGAKVSSASEETGGARRTPVTSRRSRWEAPTPKGGGTGGTRPSEMKCSITVFICRQTPIVEYSAPSV